MAQSSELDGVAAWGVGLVETLGGPGAGLAIAVENLFPPLPSEVILPLTGFAAARGVITLFEAIAWTTAGSVVGALALYALGATLGRARLYRIWARMPLVKTSDLVRTEAWFARHGTKAVFFGRMIPIFRSLISVPAGVERLRLHTFVLLTAAGSLLWNSTLVLAGYWLGEQWTVVEAYVSVFSRAVLWAVAAAVLVFVVVRLRNRRPPAA
ncbi:DedA family protein [Antribacter gilvus]|uniref:DedA family protein n=1 Tax=Antribacter gilvus TaxID=2304675 RepID=UPI00197DFD3E|nr:DedA family protein [Antribacter gilvus]